MRQFRKIIGSEEGESLELTKFEVNDQEQDSYFCEEMPLVHDQL